MPRPLGYKRRDAKKLEARRFAAVARLERGESTAGIARSLGAPAVNVCQVEDTVGETVSIVVAWELCWYRYEVDLDVQAPVARLATQGTELEELARGERAANTPVDETGLLSSPAA